MEKIVIFADDLTGAHESLSVVANSGLKSKTPAKAISAKCLLHAPSTDPPEDIVAVDLNCRYASAEQSQTLMFESMQPFGARQIFLKVDSLLRGRGVDLILALSEQSPVLFCPALPQMGRTLEDGQIMVDGTPLAETDLWAIESAEPPRIIKDYFEQYSSNGHRITAVSLAELRDSTFLVRMNELVDCSDVIICDAQTVEDLALIAAAARDTTVALAGAAGLAQAMSQEIGPFETLLDERQISSTRDSLLVLGTASPNARQQLANFRHPEVERIGWARGYRETSSQGDAVLFIDEAVGLDSAQEIEREFATYAKKIAIDKDLFLTGGSTARRILDLLDEREFRPIAEIEHGTILSRAESGRFIVTRPGSFGSDNSLNTIFETFLDIRKGTK